MSTVESIPLPDQNRLTERRYVDPPGPVEQKLIGRLVTMYEDGMRHKKKFTKPWRTVYRFYNGEQWGILPEWMSDPCENQVFARIETMVPTLTDNEPRIDINARSFEYQQYADMLHAEVTYLWERLDMNELTPMVVKNMLLFGKGFYYTYWDPDEDEIVTETVDPQNIIPDPDATSVRDARYLIHVTRMSRAEILNLWPEARGKIQRGAMAVPDPEKFKGEVREQVHTNVNANYEYPEDVGGDFSRVVPWVKADLQEGARDDSMVQVLQFWIRDPEVITEPFKDPVTGHIMQDSDGNDIMVEKMKYPNGRLIIMAGDRVLHDGPNPYEHGEFPYVEMNCHSMSGEFWPVSAAQNLVSLQMTLNKLNQTLLDNARFNGNAQWVVDRTSGVKPHMLSARPGLVVEKNTPSSFVERLQAPPMPAYVMQMAEAMRSAIDAVSGIHDVTTGRKPSGITAGVAIESLQEASQTRLRLLVRNVEGAIRRLGKQWIGLMQQFYQDARTVRVTDDMTGQTMFYELTPEMIRAQWEIRVAAGSTLPQSREVRQREAIELGKLGYFDQAEVLRHIDHPGRAAVIRRVMEQRRMEQALMLAAGMQQIPGQGASAPQPPSNVAPAAPQPGPRPQVSTRGNGRFGGNG